MEVYGTRLEYSNGIVIELSVKSSKESTKPVSLLKTGNKVVEVGWVHSKLEDEEGTIMGSKLGTNT
jgi:hypothetical protein